MNYIIFTEKWFIGCIIFIIVFAFTCHLWRMNDIASFKKQLLPTDSINPQDNQSIKKEKKIVQRTSPIEDTMTGKNKKIENRSYSLNDEYDLKEKITEVILTKEETTNKGYDLDYPNNVELRISPFGFGPYPEIPDGFPFKDPWLSVANATDTQARISELIHRVHIKLWNEGKRPEGLSYENGVIYATYPNTIYVTWEYDENEDGTIERYPSEVTSGTLSDEANALLDEGLIPPDVIVYDHNEVGIDPYNYLELK